MISNSSHHVQMTIQCGCGMSAVGSVCKFLWLIMMQRSLKNKPELKLFDGTADLFSFRLKGPNWRTHDATFHSQGYGISRDKRYITWNSECVLWLPPEYRPAQHSAPIISESKLCISCASERVLIFAFDSAVLSQALAPASP